MANEGGQGTADGAAAAAGAAAGNTNDSQTKPATGDQSTQKPATGANSGDADWARKEAGFKADLTKERTARQKLNTDLATVKGQLDEATKRIQALAGVSPKDAGAEEIETIRERFGKIFGNVSKLDNPEMFAQLEELLTLLPALKRTTEHYWGRHGTNVLTQIEKKIGEEFGDALSPAQIKKIRAAYVVEAETNPEFAKLHEDDPEKAITDFTKDWIDSWIEPAKRRALANEMARRPHVPSGKDRNLVTGTGDKPIDVNDAKQVEDVLVGGFRRNGGKFARE